MEMAAKKLHQELALAIFPLPSVVRSINKKVNRITDETKNTFDGGTKIRPSLYEGESK